MVWSCKGKASYQITQFTSTYKIMEIENEKYIQIYTKYDESTFFKQWLHPLYTEVVTLWSSYLLKQRTAN